MTYTYTPTDVDQTSDVALKQWLVGHLNSYKHKKTGELIHVYAIAGPPVYAEGDSDRIDFDIELKGYAEKSTLEIDAAFSVKIPIIGTYQLAKVKGNITDGVKVTFGVSVVRGDARFYY
ncbi:hypothetical protein B0F90DRAFT_1919298 [Multifurca ochricompacta]|uniref:Uncharacterized protein n=1 Tax=Multifurca ochricompacta TaxID=376703 RepID=A0AAD4M0Y9_9AGAM|nr:hypothetical protein B0F90DRAFT_1919298 [Multifurca ochricompacta]